MGDTTDYRVDFDEAGISEKALKRLEDDLELYNAWSGSRFYGEGSCGRAQELAETVLDWMRKKPERRLRDFSVTEGPKYEWLGELVTYDAATDTLHSVSCDDDGNALITQEQLQGLWSKTLGRHEDFAKALTAYFGPGSTFATSPQVDRREYEAGGSRTSAARAAVLDEIALEMDATEEQWADWSEGGPTEEDYLEDLRARFGGDCDCDPDALPQ